MKRQIVLMNFSGAYERQSFWREWERDVCLLDCSGISGTNCYCDGEAEEALREMLRETGAEGLHFLDSGNYHYMSKLWLEKVEQPFDLLVFDHHTDVQPPAFGEILSCGGWILRTTETNPWLRQVYVAGPPSEAAEAAREELRAKAGREIRWLSEAQMRDRQGWRALLREESWPLYLSVDKDILEEEAADTNWDQGSMDRDTLLVCLEEAMALRRVIGMDVCGENPEEEASGCRSEENERTNRELAERYLRACSG